MKSNRVIKILAVVCISLFIVAITIARNSPATGYEASIYTATPSLVWGFLIFGTLCGIGIVVHQVHTNRIEQDKLWSIGFLIIMLSYTAFLSLWIIRGYGMWCSGDPMNHLMYIKGVISTGHVSSGNIYPITHIYLAQISQICGVDPIVPHKFIPFMMGILYVAFMYLFAGSVLPKKGQIILTAVAATTLIQGWYLNLTPNGLANLAFPLALFLMVKSFSPGTVVWRGLFLLMIFLFPPFHVLTGFTLLIIVIGMWLMQRVLATRGEVPQRDKGAIATLGISAGMLLFVWNYLWISNFGTFGDAIRNVYTLIAEGGTTHAASLLEKAQYASGLGFSLKEEFVKVYSGYATYLIFAGVSFWALWKRWRQQENLRNLFTLYGPLAACVLTVVGLYFSNLPFGPGRFYIYLIIICTMFVGFILYEVLKRGHNWQQHTFLKKLVPLLVIIALFGLSMHGALKLYPSPYIHSTNWQVARTEIKGMDWFLHNKSTVIETKAIGLSLSRFAAVLMTPEERHGRKDIYTEVGDSPYHFGYDKYPTLGESYSEDAYLVVSAQDKTYFTDVFPEIADIRFVPQDYEGLEQDPSVDKLYHSGEFDVYYVHGRASPTSE